ncbi:hypothetical protein [Sphingomonas sp. VNH70]|uniref:hypothetical protein n=1 Tax=Sphingomonas silueang TaxID=3156617 RepID=UPI0032B5F19D
MTTAILVFALLQAAAGQSSPDDAVARRILNDAAISARGKVIGMATVNDASVSGRTLTLTIGPTRPRDAREVQDRMLSEKWTPFCGSMRVRSAMQRYAVSIRIDLPASDRVPAETVLLDEQRCASLIDLGSKSVIKCDIAFETLDVDTAGRDTGTRQDQETQYFVLYDGVRAFGRYDQAKGFFEPVCEGRTCRGSYDGTAVVLTDESQNGGYLFQRTWVLDRTRGMIELRTTRVEANRSFATGSRQRGTGTCVPSDLPAVTMPKF